MTTTTTDRIEKTIVLRAPRSKVWRALTNAEEFGTWFRVKLQGNFVAGQTIRGNITNPGWEHIQLEATVETIEPETRFSYWWRPYALDPKVDYSSEPKTLVEFRLEDVVDGTKLVVTESGFDGIPAWRRDEAFRMNSNGWAAQLENIKKYVAG